MSAMPMLLGTTWSGSVSSRWVRTGEVNWYVQEAGSGPALLLIHGTGASSHSWRDLAPLLARRFTVIAPDLPGHGFSGAPASVQVYSLPGMAQALGALLRALKVAPELAVGHSAGAAILARMALDRLLVPRVLISINGALLPMAGMPGWLFAPLARLLAGSRFVPRLVARRAHDRSAIERLIRNTGSRLNAAGVNCYHALARDPGHVGAVLQMMANWDLHELARELPRLQVPLVLLGANGDRTIPPQQLARLKILVPDAKALSLGDLGHLAHEEDPELAARLILHTAVSAGILPETE